MRFYSDEVNGRSWIASKNVWVVRKTCHQILISVVDSFCKIVKKIGGQVAAPVTYDPNYSLVQKGIAKEYVLEGKSSVSKFS